MYKAFLIKYAEIAIKGKNRYIFEDALVRNIRYQLKNVDGNFIVRKENGRIYAEAQGDYDYDEVVTALQRVFGIVAICPVILVEDEGFEALTKTVLDHIDAAYPDKNFTFKVVSRRARKNYPMPSMELSAATHEHDDHDPHRHYDHDANNMARTKPHLPKAVLYDTCTYRTDGNRLCLWPLQDASGGLS